MENSKSFDLIVIGTGAAASTIAYKCNAAGWKVAVIDSRPFGGTCALRGCDPKKVLVGAAEVIDANHRMKDKGLHHSGTNTAIDWKELIQFKRTFTDPVPKNREDAFNKAGITTYHGRAQFRGPRSIKIVTEPDDKAANYIEGKYIVIASGAKPVDLNVPGKENIITSDQFLDLEELPKTIVFVGGGYISFEFAHIAACAGSKVKILHRGSRPLNNFDPDLVAMLVERTKDIGVDVQIRTEVKSIERHDKNGNIIVNTLLTKDMTGPEVIGVSQNTTHSTTFEPDMVVHGAGRVPDIEDLQLDVGGVEIVDTNKRASGIKVNEFLQSTSNSSVYAAGDVAASGGMPLTPVASYEGEIVATNLLEGNHLTHNYLGIPSVVFTIPPLASVGLHEEAAKSRGIKFKTNYGDTSNWYSSRRIGESHSGYKVLVEESTGKVLGAHLLGPHADEVINIFALAIRLGIGSNDLKNMMYSYPTNSSDIRYML
ncbi:MAG: NAD(P)/FAD-dependent oxidoreductase [Nitrososphaeraceae archaeon]